MDEDAGIAQAGALLRELYKITEDIAPKLEAAEDRNRRAQARGVSRRDPIVTTLRRELYETHRLHRWSASPIPRNGTAD